MGPELIAWTVRLGILCFTAVLGVWAAGCTGPAIDRYLRWVWTGGWFLFFFHMLAAFHFQHHWSHAHAVADTARQTLELIGWEFGGGVYFNYLFLLLWGADLVLWWQGKQSADWYRPLRRMLIGYLIFIAFNGVVVFKSGWLRWAGTAATLGLSGIWLARITKQKQAA